MTILRGDCHTGEFSIGEPRVLLMLGRSELDRQPNPGIPALPCFVADAGARAVLLVWDPGGVFCVAPAAVNTG